MTEPTKLYVKDIIDFLDYRWTIMDEPFVVVGDEYIPSLKEHYENKITEIAEEEGYNYKIVITPHNDEKKGMSVFTLKEL
jgi:hypothetical protein